MLSKLKFQSQLFIVCVLTGEASTGKLQEARWGEEGKKTEGRTKVSWISICSGSVQKVAQRCNSPPKFSIGALIGLKTASFAICNIRWPPVLETPAHDNKACVDLWGHATAISVWFPVDQTLSQHCFDCDSPAIVFVNLLISRCFLLMQTFTSIMGIADTSGRFLRTASRKTRDQCV